MGERGESERICTNTRPGQQVGVELGWREKGTGKRNGGPPPSGGGMGAGVNSPELCAECGRKAMCLSPSSGLAQPGLPAAARSRKVTLAVAVPSGLGEEEKGTPSRRLPPHSLLALQMPTLKLLEVDSPHPGRSWKSGLFPTPLRRRVSCSFPGHSAPV